MEGVLHESITSVSEPERDSTPDLFCGAAAMAAALMLAGVVSPVAAAPDKIAKAPPLPDLPTPGRALIGVEQPRAIPALGSPTAGLWIKRQQKSNGQLANAREDAGDSRCPALRRIGTATVSPRRASSPVVTGW